MAEAEERTAERESGSRQTTAHANNHGSRRPGIGDVEGRHLIGKRQHLADQRYAEVGRGQQPWPQGL